MFKHTKKIYTYLNAGALGDITASLPTLLLLHKRNQLEKIILNPRFIEYFKLFFPDELLFDADKQKDVKNEKGETLRILDLVADKDCPVMKLGNETKSLITSLHISLIDIASINLTGCILKPEEKNYPLVDATKLPENKVKSKKYVVIAYGYTSPLRKMKVNAFNAMRNYLIKKGYDVVLLGSTKHSLTYSDGSVVEPKYQGISYKGCIDMIDKTSLVEALSIINGSCGIIGLDNGLIHLAALTEVPIVCGYTTVDPYFRLPYRHNEMGWNVYTVEPDSECRYCQTSNFVLLGIDFAKCPDNNSAQCTESLHPDKWMSVITDIFV
jgi:ADP-heptose:LPS heptosyltransferase